MERFDDLKKPQNEDEVPHKLNDMEEKPEYYIDIDGIKCAPIFVPEIVRSAMKYRPGKDEVIVASYPKCGTSWTMMIVLLLMKRGKPLKTAKEYFSRMIYIDMNLSEQIESLSKPKCLKTHFPFHRMTYSSDAKYIYVARHPADCVVSYYYHTLYFPYYRFTDDKFETIFELFLKGEVDFNDYFDHLLSWYEWRNLPNVLFMTFESMKEDHKGAVMKIARFLEDGLCEELVANDESMLKDVMRYSSVDYMRSAVNGFYEEAFAAPPPVDCQDFAGAVMNKYRVMLENAKKRGFEQRGNFVRKGEVGDGKVSLSEEQRRRLKTRIIEKTCHSDVMDLWKDA